MLLVESCVFELCLCFSKPGIVVELCGSRSCSAYSTAMDVIWEREGRRNGRREEETGIEKKNRCRAARVVSSRYVSASYYVDEAGNYCRVVCQQESLQRDEERNREDESILEGEGCVCEGCVCEGCVCEGCVCEGCLCFVICRSCKFSSSCTAAGVASTVWIHRPAAENVGDREEKRRGEKLCYCRTNGYERNNSGQFGSQGLDLNGRRNCLHCSSPFGTQHAHWPGQRTEP